MVILENHLVCLERMCIGCTDNDLKSHEIKKRGKRKCVGECVRWSAGAGRLMAGSRSWLEGAACRGRSYAGINSVARGPGGRQSSVKTEVGRSRALAEEWPRLAAGRVLAGGWGRRCVIMRTLQG